MGMTLVEFVAKLGLDLDEASFKKGEKLIDNITKGLKTLVEAEGARKIFDFMEGVSERAVNAAHQVDIMSERFGVSAEKLQQLGAIAPDLGIEGVGQAMKFLARNAFEASTKGGEMADTFRRLGVGSLNQSNGQLKTADELLEDVADGMERIKDPTVRAALAQKLLGREGAQFVNILKDGRKGIEESIKKINQYGYFMGPKFRYQADKTRESHHAMERSFTGFGNILAERLMPAFERIYNAAAKFVSWFSEAADKSHILEITLDVLSGIMLGLAARTLLAVAPWLLWAAAIAGLILIFDEVVTALRGGKTVFGELGRVIDQLFDSFMSFQSGNPIVNFVLQPIKDVLFFMRQLGNLIPAFVMLASGDTGGFKQIWSELQEQAGRAGAAYSFQTSQVAGPSGAASTAAAGASAFRANVNVTNNHTIHAGNQSPEAIADAVDKKSHEGFEKAMHSAYHGLTAGKPLAAVPGGG